MPGVSPFGDVGYVPGAIFCPGGLMMTTYGEPSIQFTLNLTHSPPWLDTDWVSQTPTTSSVMLESTAML